MRSPAPPVSKAPQGRSETRIPAASARREIVPAPGTDRRHGAERRRYFQNRCRTCSVSEGTIGPDETWEPAVHPQGPHNMIRRNIPMGSRASGACWPTASLRTFGRITGWRRHMATEAELATQAKLSCRCGEVQGVVRNASPQNVNRVVCYCDDCQAFLHRLGRTDLLNARGGTDIVQVVPASLAFVRGQDRIKGLRLTPKGIHRWYASCCNTPVGNTFS